MRILELNFGVNSSIFCCAIFVSIFGVVWANDANSSNSTQEPIYSTPEQRLYNHLLKNYQNAVRPAKNATHIITVKVGLTLMSILDLDEKNQVLATNVWLDQEWTDELLSWNPDDFDGVTSIIIPWENIWQPDIVLYNGADDYSTGSMRSRAIIQHDGTIFWPIPTRLRSTCKIDVTYFPFDSQRCFLKFGSWAYHGFQVNVTNRSDSIDTSNYVTNSEFDLVTTHQKRRDIKYTCCPEPYPDVVFFIHVRRKALYYVYNVIVPCIILSALTLLVFWLPPGAGDKVGLAMTILFCYSIFVLAIAEKMPETSDSMPLIGVYLTVVMGLTSLSVLAAIIVLNIHNRGQFKKRLSPQMRQLILHKLRYLLCMQPPKKLRASTSASASVNATNGSSADTEDQKALLSSTLAEVDSTKGANSDQLKLQWELLKTLKMLISKKADTEIDENEWHQAAQVIDRLLFWIFFALTVGITFLLLFVLPGIYQMRESLDMDDAAYGLHK